MERGLHHCIAYCLKDDEWRVLDSGDLLNMDVVMDEK